MCWLRFPFAAKVYSQNSHLNGFFPSWWDITWVFKLIFLADAYSQSSHLNGFFPPLNTIKLRFLLSSWCSDLWSLDFSMKVIELFEGLFKFIMLKVSVSLDTRHESLTIPVFVSGTERVAEFWSMFSSIWSFMGTSISWGSFPI